MCMPALARPLSDRPFARLRIALLTLVGLAAASPLAAQRAPAYDVLVRAEEIERNENDIFQWIGNGESIQQIVDKGGYF